MLVRANSLDELLEEGLVRHISGTKTFVILQVNTCTRDHMPETATTVLSTAIVYIQCGCTECVSYVPAQPRFPDASPPPGHISPCCQSTPPAPTADKQAREYSSVG